MGWFSSVKDTYRESGGRKSESTGYAVERDGATEPAGSDRSTGSR